MKWFMMIAMLILALTGCGKGPAEVPEGHQFVYQEVVISASSDVAEVLAALGEPKGYTETASCAVEGVDKTYCYGSFYLVTCPWEGAERAARLWFADDSVSTREGVRIGDSRAAVERAYETAAWDQNTCTILQGENKLTILLENDIVCSVQYEWLLP